ncbi:MAG: helix-turn-helix transcriptional regulator [Symbiopectobacterium sp.]|uniref:helix-turn-helix transcriptional regulator n=1 Tax=Symbiopectobacterium sp. TaxID=2952789 RepID=UPI003F339106
MIPIISDTDLITIKEVERSVGLKNPAFTCASVMGNFPSKKNSAPRTARWVRSEIEAWKKQFL